MRVTVKQFSVGHLTGKRFSRALLWLAMVVLTLQLIGAAHHKHGLTDQSSDCVSCYIAAHFPADIPPVAAEILSALAILAYCIVLLPLSTVVATQHYLTPPSQAPPRVLSPL